MSQGSYSQVRHMKGQGVQKIDITLQSPQQIKRQSSRDYQSNSYDNLTSGKRSSQKRASYKPPSSNYASIEFEPSSYYLYEKMKYNHEVQSKCDRLKMFQKANTIWQNDSFLKNNHKVNNNGSKEGRKLNLAEYNQKFSSGKALVKKNPKNAPQNKLSSYVIPSERKRDDLRYEIRMKMMRASAITFNRPFSSDGKVRVNRNKTSVGGQMPRTSRRESEDHSNQKKRRRESPSPRKDTEKSHRKRDEKREEKKSSKKDKSPHKAEEPERSPSHVQTRRMSSHQPAAVLNEQEVEGAYENFPQITQKTIDGLKKRGINYLFQVQSSSFPVIWARKDVIVRDLTGSGKTLAFALPLVEYLRKNKLFGTGKIQGIVLAPTRELALQVTKEFNFLKHSENEYNVLTVYGGVSIDDQTYQLRRGVDIFVGTTGRVLDHMERKNFDFSQLKTIVLDETDQMLKQGFKEDVERIMENIKQKAPKDLQVLLFSATIPSWVKQVARDHLSPNFETIDLAQNLKNKTSKTVNHLAVNCPYQNRMSALADILICYGGVGQTIVFCSTKAEANSLLLTDKIKQDIEVMHGDIAQNQREVTLKRFKEGKFSVLVATDVASRGLDIPNVDLVIQVEPPKETETYIHRAGRTARAGRVGTCITFYGKKHMPLIQMIEQKAGIKFQKIGIPQPEDVIKASSRDILKQLDQVNDQVIPLFEETAEQLIEKYHDDPKKALCVTLAFLSGHYKQMLGSRSLLTGQEKCITMEMRFDNSFHSVSFVWNILKKFIPDTIVNGIRGMRMFKDQKGVVFDVQDDAIARFEDIFNHLKEEKRIDFKIGRAKELPELKEDSDFQGGNQGYGGNRGGYGGGYGGGYQQNNNGYQGRSQYGSNNGGSYGGNKFDQSYQQRNQSRGPGGSGNNDDRTVFVGNLGFNTKEKDISDLFAKEGRLNPSRIRMLQDNEGKFRGAAFVEFDSPNDAQSACKLDGRQMGDRRLRINPAGNKPSGTR